MAMTIRPKMRKLIYFVLPVFLGLGVWVYSVQSGENNVRGEMMTDKKRIFLIGASVGKEWKLPELPKRVNDDRHVFESTAVYQFDKTDALEEVLMRPKRKFHLTRTYLKGFFKPAPQRPEMIIIKECAAYFPGDLELYKARVKGWVKRIREAKIEAALATVVPVTKDRAERQKGKIESIREYNDFIREYAHSENIPLLDLEAALRTDGEKRFLKDDYSSGDGLHLNKKAYDVLDVYLEAAL